MFAAVVPMNVIAERAFRLFKGFEFTSPKRLYLVAAAAKRAKIPKKLLAKPGIRQVVDVEILVVKSLREPPRYLAGIASVIHFKEIAAEIPPMIRTEVFGVLGLSQRAPPRKSSAFGQVA